MSRLDELPDWADYEPHGEREELAYALMVAGVCIDDPSGGVLLDSGLADMVLEALHHRGVSLVRTPLATLNTCAVYWGSDETLCATHGGRLRPSRSSPGFASTVMRCDRALASKP